MPRSIENLRNVIICDDIRQEIGNKQSLMGIFGGDLIVAELPATIQIAIFFQYLPTPEEEDGIVHIEVELFQDDLKIVGAKMETLIKNQQPASFALPKAMVIFDKECTFKMMASVDEKPKQPVMTKKVIKGIPPIA